MRVHDIAFYTAVFFISGIAAASFGINVWFVLVLTPLLGAALFYLRRELALSFLSMVIIFGFFYYYFYSALNKEIIVYEKSIVFQGIVSREPKSGLKSQMLNLSLAPPYNGEVKVYTSPYPEFHYGDLLTLEGTVKKSYRGENISSFPKIKLISGNHGNFIQSQLFKIKGTLVKNLQSILPTEKSALASGIIFGERAEFSNEFKENLNRSGTAHIVALSGYNISIIGVGLSTVLVYFLNRRKAFYLSLFFIVAFVLMTGAEPSVVRAGIMGIIVMLSEQQSRIYSFRNAITLTAFTMLLFDPRLLVFDVGFELSFAALLGIVYLQPLLTKLISNFYEKIVDPGLFGWRKNLLQTFSAQLAVLPILIKTFGYFSPFSLLSNVLVLEFIPLTMFLGFMASVLGIFSYHLSLVIGWLTGILLGYEIFIINLFGSFDF